MIARGRTRVRLFAFLGAGAAALLIAALALQPSREPRGSAAPEPPSGEREAATASGDGSQRVAVRGAVAPGSDPELGAGGTGLAGSQRPLDRDEIARIREERRSRRAAERAAWEEQKRASREQSRARALERAKGDPELHARLKAQYAWEDERDRLREERREQRRSEHAERAARLRALGGNVPRASDAPVLGPPVIGADGVAYDPRGRTP